MSAIAESVLLCRILACISSCNLLGGGVSVLAAPARSPETPLVARFSAGSAWAGDSNRHRHCHITTYCSSTVLGRCDQLTMSLRTIRPPIHHVTADHTATNPPCHCGPYSHQSTMSLRTIRPPIHHVTADHTATNPPCHCGPYSHQSTMSLRTIRPPIHHVLERAAAERN